MPRRSEGVLETVRREVELHRQALDADVGEEVVQVVLTVKFVASTGEVRGSNYAEERVKAKGGNLPIRSAPTAGA